MHRAKQNIQVQGEVRDGRKQNGKEGRLSEDQLEAVVTLMYDDWEKRHHVDAEKIRSFCVQVQTDATLVALLGGEVCSEEEAWKPSKQRISAIMKRFKISSHKTTARPSSRDRPSMEAELKWVDTNFQQWSPHHVVVIDETAGVSVCV